MGVLFCNLFVSYPSDTPGHCNATMQFSLHLDKGKADDGRDTSTESHREVLIHKMPQLGNRTPGHMGE